MIQESAVALYVHNHTTTPPHHHTVSTPEPGPQNTRIVKGHLGCNAFGSGRCWHRDITNLHGSCCPPTMIFFPSPLRDEIMAVIYKQRILTLTSFYYRQGATPSVHTYNELHSHFLLTVRVYVAVDDAPLISGLLSL